MPHPRPALAPRSGPAAWLLAASLAACGPDPADTGAPADTAAPDPADPDTAADTDTADTAPSDTAPDPLGAHVWPGAFGTAPDLRVSSCGSTHGSLTVAPGPDLDGDGLPEVAVGAPGDDGVSSNEGAVYLFRGADLASAATIDMAAAWARVRDEEPVAFADLGERLQWLGDRDGDGVADLLVWRAAYGGHPALVSGADLLAGGDVAPGDYLTGLDHAFARWDDVDGDGRDDWLVAYASHFGGYDGIGLTVVPDPDLTLTGSSPGLGSVLVLGLGGLLRVLDEDRDGDGLRELVTRYDRDLVVVSSAALLSGAAVEAAVLDRLDVSYVTTPEDVLDLGDLDGGGANELLLRADDRVCFARGEDADPAGRLPTCVRSTEAEPARAVARGGDLDGDGVPEVWAQLAEALVAWDGAALGDGVRIERARIAHAGAYGDALSTDEAGAVWVASIAGDTPAAIRRFPAADGLADADATVSLVGDTSAADPGGATWVDLTGDGVDDLVFLADTVHRFDGARLADGGALTMCDADAAVPVGLDDPLFVEDLDGDGVPELFGADYDDGVVYRLLSGAALDGPPLAEWPAERTIEPLGCDLDGDGREDFFDDDASDTTVLYGGAVVATGDPDGAVLGQLDGERSLRCVPDVEGDGRPELLFLDSPRFALVLSSQLDPTRAIPAEEAWTTLVDEGYPGWASVITPGDLDGDGVSDPFFLRAEQVEDVIRPVSALCTIDPARLAEGGELEADTVDTCGAPWLFYGAVSAVAHAIGDSRADLVVFYENTAYDTVFAAIDDAGLGAPVVIATVPGGSWHAGGFGPDVLGTGAPSLWAVTSPDDGRPVFEMLYARFPGEE